MITGTITLSWAKKSKKYCSSNCSFLAKTKIPGMTKKPETHEEWLAYHNTRAKLYYHTHLKGTEAFKKKTAERNARYDMKHPYVHRTNRKRQRPIPKKIYKFKNPGISV